MKMLTVDMLRVQVTISVNRNVGFSLQGRKNIGLFSHGKLFTDKLCRGNGANFKAFASKNIRKKLKKGLEPETRTLQTNKVPSEGYEKLKDNSITQDENTSDITAKSDSANSYARSTIPSPSRKVVLQACSVSSVLILALGAALRQASHIAFTEGWLNHDSSNDISFSFETWHLGLVVGLVILISSCRYLLLKMWPDFAESSEAANEQVLSSLQPLDYVVVAFLPGISEELLFRGALLPFVGLNWKSALAIGAVFGILHLGGGRRYSYAIWSTFVGFAYGMATIITSSIIVPMASHSFNNLVGGVLWRYRSTSQENPM